MMKRKFLMIGVILLAICISIGAVCADDSWSFNFGSSSESNSDGGDINIENNHVKIQGLEFDIPDGFEENESARVVGEETDEDSFPGLKVSKVEFDKGDDFIVIKAIFGDEDIDADSYTPGEDTIDQTINDVDGYLSEQEDGATFDYIKDGKLVEIVTSDKELLNDLVQ